MQPIANWNLVGTPWLIDIGRQLCTRVTGSQPLYFRRYAWWIRRFPRLALKTTRAAVLWDDYRTCAPFEYKPRIHAGGPR